MPFLICPECGEHNPLEAEICQVCQASLEGVLPSEDPTLPEPEQDDFDLFSSNDADLPGLLESLKQEELPAGAGGLPKINMDAESEDASHEDEPSEENKTPDWLNMVRKRAREEEDALGDLTKRVFDAQENLKSEKRESQHDDFENWIQKLRDEARDKAAGEPAQPEEEAGPSEDEMEENEPRWLTRIRKTHGLPEDERNEPDAAGRSLLEWLVELEEQRTSGRPKQDTEVTQPITLSTGARDSDATREIRISELQEKKAPSVINLTREDRDQADRLTATIADETADRSVEKHPFRKPIGILNIIFALILIVGISFMLVTGRVVSFTNPQLSVPGQAVLDWAAGLSDDAQVLIVFDYQPGYKAEMERIVKPILARVFDSINAVDVVSSSPSGTLLSADLLADFATVSVTDLGYVPGEAYGAFGFAMGAVTDSLSLNLPAPDRAYEPEHYTDVLILSDQFESARGWVEQWQALSPETTLNLLVTAQAGPMLHPYAESGQVNGLVAGLAEAVAVEASLGQKGPAAAVWQAYQVGILVMIGGLVLGAVAGIGGSRGQDERGEG